MHEMPHLNDFSECILIDCAFYFVIGDKVIQFNSKEHIEAPLMEGIDPASITFGDYPAL